MQNIFKAIIDKINSIFNTDDNERNTQDCNYNNDYYGDQLCRTK